MKNLIIASLVTFAVIAAPVLADGFMSSSLHVDSGTLNQYIGVDVSSPGPDNFRDSMYMSGNGLNLDTTVQVGGGMASYSTDAYAASSYIDQTSTIYAFGFGTPWFKDRTQMWGEKLHLQKSAVAGLSQGPNNGAGATYYTKAWTDNRETWGWNKLHKYTYIKNHIDDDYGYQDLWFKTRASGPCEPDKFKLETMVGVGTNSSIGGGGLGLIVWDKGFVKGDIADFSGKIFADIDGNKTTFTLSGHAAPGRVDWKNFVFQVDL